MCDFGVPAIQCLADFSRNEQIRLDFHPTPAGFRGLFHRYIFFRNAYLVPERKLSFSPISASDSNFNPRNTQCMSVVKIFVFLDLNEKS